MAPQEDLKAITDDFSVLATRFVEGTGELFLRTEDQAEFKRKMLEATSLLDDLLGRGNRYTLNALQTANAGSSGFYGGPSLACVVEVQAILKAAMAELARKTSTAESPSTGRQPDPYVGHTRLEELQNLHVESFDLQRLIRLCEELNIAHVHRSFMTIGFLVRAIMDHVPPIFGVRTFSEVANNYPGAKSFKVAMEHLDRLLRAAADAHLHIQIRASEVLPSFQQFDFRGSLDMLLAEIVRILRLPVSELGGAPPATRLPAPGAPRVSPHKASVEASVPKVARLSVRQCIRRREPTFFDVRGRSATLPDHRTGSVRTFYGPSISRVGEAWFGCVRLVNDPTAVSQQTSARGIVAEISYQDALGNSLTVPAGRWRRKHSPNEPPTTASIYGDEEVGLDPLEWRDLDLVVKATADPATCFAFENRSVGHPPFWEDPGFKLIGKLLIDVRLKIGTETQLIQFEVLYKDDITGPAAENWKDDCPFFLCELKPG